jgi:UDP-hydrolysing UDP-N-acetyl-D-glucosamine 2-epimerase
MTFVGVVTGARSDYGIYRSVLRGIAASDRLRLGLFVCGMHLSPEFGLTVGEIEAEGHPILERVETLLSSDSPQGVAASMGLGVLGFARAFSRNRPDILLVLGDRYEMFAAAAAAVPFGIPLAHIHGGEATYGVIDEAFRHALTKMSHLHFASTAAYAARIARMGEEPWRITVSGAPALDSIAVLSPLSREELERDLDCDLGAGPILVTNHPTTLECGPCREQTATLLEALARTGRPLIITYPNADTASRDVLDTIRAFVAATPRARLFTSLGARRYFSLLPHVAAMAGNSSSGIIEAASFALPVVNLGSRQDGRIRAENVIDAPYARPAIDQALEKALDPAFRDSLRGMANPYGDGRAAERIVHVLENAPSRDRLLFKKFHEPEASGTGGRRPASPAPKPA